MTVSKDLADIISNLSSAKKLTSIPTGMLVSHFVFDQRTAATISATPALKSAKIPSLHFCNLAIVMPNYKNEPISLHQAAHAE